MRPKLTVIPGGGRAAACARTSLRLLPAGRTSAHPADWVRSPAPPGLPRPEIWCSVAEEPEFEIWRTVDEFRARNAIGKTYVVGGVPHKATSVEEVVDRVWIVRGTAQYPWSRPKKENE